MGWGGGGLQGPLEDWNEMAKYCSGMGVGGISTPTSHVDQMFVSRVEKKGNVLVVSPSPLGSGPRGLFFKSTPGNLFCGVCLFF